MIDADRKAIEAYWKVSHSMETPQAAKEAAQNTLKAALSEDVAKPEVFCRWLEEACQKKDGDALEYVMALGWIFTLFNEESVAVLKKVALENWHHSMEDMVSLIEAFGGADRDPLLARMALQKYPGHYLGEDDEYVTRKCMWALHRLYQNHQDAGALERIKELALCGDAMVEGFAKHHLEKLGVAAKES